ncbi:hypothetical protein [Blastopirellula retiformator]|uniref:hypothetical protein n=1 Tax=Blastopirellula retiformator TaxID=2527970 RepID=UPI001C96E5AE|nr:hypothetical protein [Blastopirellula retiformator]
MVDFGGENHFRIEIDRVLGLVFQVRAAIFHLADLGVGGRLADPFFVRDLLVFPPLIEPAQLL